MDNNFAQNCACGEKMTNMRYVPMILSILSETGDFGETGDCDEY